ncbi:MAG TPA: amidohydrolase family protein [Burkholderiales bacterium]|nr:amidohydrolase family protein [Burkholderiales bacterium]
MAHNEEAAPAFKAPPGACDSHFHVFGAVGRYRYGADIRYQPPLAPLEDYLELARHLGIERYVFVQPSAYGRDNACMLDAMGAVGTGKCRGIVDIDQDAPDAEFDRLNRIGVRGVRINENPIKPFEPGYSKTMLSRIQALDARCAEIGWMLDFLTPGWLTLELLPVMKKLKSLHTVAHMGMFLAKEGPQQPGFQQFLDYLRSGDRCWVKFTGTYRMSVTPGFTDAAPMARALIGAVPDRIIWGSDFPHLSFADKVGSVELFNLLGQWSDEAQRRKILVDNPQRLFGF